MDKVQNMKEVTLISILLQGMYCFPDGGRYEGEFKEGELNGKGANIFE